MRALTLTQPWATLVALGAKQIETRSWQTPHLGSLAIHAAKGFQPHDMELFNAPYFAEALSAAGYMDFGGLPRGAVVATAFLEGCFKITKSLSYELDTGRRIRLTDQEIAFGDYTPGRFGWCLRAVKAIEPIAARGSLGLWEWEQYS